MIHACSLPDDVTDDLKNLCTYHFLRPAHPEERLGVLAVHLERLLELEARLLRPAQLDQALRPVEAQLEEEPQLPLLFGVVGQGGVLEKPHALEVPPLGASAQDARVVVDFLLLA